MIMTVEKIHDQSLQKYGGRTGTTPQSAMGRATGPGIKITEKKPAKKQWACWNTKDRYSHDMAIYFVF